MKARVPYQEFKHLRSLPEKLRKSKCSRSPRPTVIMSVIRDYKLKFTIVHLWLYDLISGLKNTDGQPVN